MFALLNRSVRFKVTAVILATTLAALLVASAALLSYDVRRYRASVIADIRTQAAFLADANKVTLQYDDPKLAQESLSPLTIRQDILAAAIYTADGELFAAYEGRGELGKPPPALDPRAVSDHRVSFAGGVTELAVPVIAENEEIGTVFLRASYDLGGRVQDYLLILGAVILLSLGVAAFISLQLQRSITAPVRAVSSVARKVVEQRDFALRAKKTTDDEIGVLVDSFNAMLSEVGSMTETLETTNRRLRQETEERRSAEAALRVADRRKDEFLATLAHELRNPLAPMVNALGMIDVSTLGPDAQRARDIIDRQLGHMVRLVDDLLDVSRITRGKLAVHMAEVELGGIIRSAVDTVRPVIEARGHQLDVALPDDAIYLRGDAVRLSQVFSNVLNNAAKYTPTGGHIALAAELEGDRVKVTITDDGIGMSKETLGMIFEMFTQAPGDKTSRAQSGLGVGLALSRRLVELHGGTISAKSAGPDHGSTFEVQLPASAKAKPTHDPAPSTTAATEPAVPQPRRILLVDDNVDFATSLAILLETLGHEVRVAHEAKGAIEAAAELRPHVAFLDIGLPDISGYEVATRLRALPECVDTTMIALSGWGQIDDRKRSYEAGFAEHLVKPVDLKTIENVLAGLADDR